MDKKSAIARFVFLLLFVPLGAHAQATPPQTQGEPYQIGGDVSAPVRISGADPKYPGVALKGGISGRVVLALWIEKDGTVSHITVEQGLSDDLDHAALQAVSHWVFKPAMKDGNPVTVQAKIGVRFVIEP